MEAKLWTFQEAVEHLLDVLDIDTASGRRLRQARSSVEEAYIDLANQHRWSYYDRQDTIRTVASSTDTITYDHTGGSSERLLTFASTTLPTDAHYYRVVIADTHYPIEEYKSSTTCTLTAESNPGSDVAAGTSATLYRSEYPLPPAFRKLGRIFDVENEHELAVVGSDTQHAASIHFYDTPDTPWQVAIRNTGDIYSGLSMIFGPPPSSARTYDYLFHTAPRPLKIYKYSTGTVSVTAGSTTANFTGATLPEEVAGSIIRFSSGSTNEPTPPSGALTGTDDLYYAQRVIISRVSGSQATIDQSMTDSLSGVKYTISDPIDIEPHAMLTAFQALSEAVMARLIRQDGVAAKWRLAERKIRDAMAADNRAPVAKSVSRYDRFTRAIVTTDA